MIVSESQLYQKYNRHFKYLKNALIFYKRSYFIYYWVQFKKLCINVKFLHLFWQIIAIIQVVDLVGRNKIIIKDKFHIYGKYFFCKIGPKCQ